MLYRNIFVVGVCVFLLFVASCDEQAAAPLESAGGVQVQNKEVAGDASEVSSDMLVSLDGKQFTKKHVSWMRPDSDDARMAGLANWWLETELLYAEAEKRGITNDEKTKFLANLRFKQAFSKELVSQIRESVEVSAKEVQDYYNENRDTDVRLQQPGHVSFTHIRTNTLEEGQAALKRIEAGEDMGEVAKEVSVFRDARNGGVVSKYVHRRIEGRYGKEFLETLLSTEVGKLIGPIQTKGGEYEVVRLDEKIETVIKSFEEVKGRIESQLLITKKDEAAMNLMGSLKEKAAGRIVKSPLVSRIDEEMKKKMEKKKQEQK